MMNPSEGTFEPLPKPLDQELRELAGMDRTKFKAALTAIEIEQGKPTIYVGEVVEIKGVKFTVQRIRAVGSLVLRMVPGQKWPKDAGGGA